MMTYRDDVQIGFYKNERDGVVYFTIPAFCELPFLRHGFTSRIGGVSEAPRDSLNLSFRRDPSCEHVLENFAIAARAMGMDEHSLVINNYEHENKLERADASMHGFGLWRENALPLCDGLYVDERGTTAVTLHADCNSLFFADVKGRAAGVFHSGWRGTLANCVAPVLTAMKQKGIAPSELLFGIGPAICERCFEVQEDVAALFRPHYEGAVHRYDNAQLRIDLIEVLLTQLEEGGVPAKNVTLSALCTYCNSELFYSHRRDGENAGAMGSFIALK